MWSTVRPGVLFVMKAFPSADIEDMQIPTLTHKKLNMHLIGG